MNSAAKILVIDDERGIRDLLAYELGSRGYQVVTAPDGEQGLLELKKDAFHLVISDVMMPKLGGLDTLAAVKRINPDVEVILATGFATIDDAVIAMKHGAYDFIQKPFDVDALAALIEKALEKRELKTVIALYETSKVLLKTIKLDTLLPLITKLTRAALRADDVSILLEEGAELRVAASLGVDGAPRLDARRALAERVAGRTAAAPEPVILLGPLEEDPRFDGIECLRDIKATLLYPLSVDGEALGVLCVNRTALAEPFTDEDLRHVTIFGAQIAQAVCNARAFQRLKDAQERLIHSERMNAVGKLAAGVAHELNNPLTSILGLSKLMLAEPALSAEQREDLECILAQSQRCAVITQGLLQFGRKREPKMEALGVESLIASVLRLSRLDMTAKNIRVVLDAPAPGPAIMADLCQMQQVLLNVIVNAGHAMEANAEKILTIRVRAESGRARIELQDNGCGISPANLERVFEPFFTTKPAGKGTGLGLSISRDIMLQHDGALRLSSSPGAGTTVALDLPLAPLSRTRQEPLGACGPSPAPSPAFQESSLSAGRAFPPPCPPRSRT